MDYLPKDELEPSNDGAGKGADGANGKGKRPGPSRNRIIFWVVGGGVGLYMFGSGLIGALTK